MNFKTYKKALINTNSGGAAEIFCSGGRLFPLFSNNLCSQMKALLKENHKKSILRA